MASNSTSLEGGCTCRGVRYRAVGASRLLRDHILIYGVGGLIAPFIGIKLIDMALVALHLA